MPRESAFLLSELAAGRVKVSDITRTEALMIISYSRWRVRRAQVKIGAFISRGSSRIANREQRQLLFTPAARVVAADDAIRKFDLHQHRRRLPSVSHGGPERFSRVWGLAQKLKAAPANPPRAVVRMRRKARGGYRRVYMFDDIGIARQKLAVTAMKPFSSFLHQSQYTMRGRSAACEELLLRMNRANSDTRFIQFDVENFYGSISHRWLEEHLHLPKNIIRQSILLDDVRIIRGKAPAHLQGEVNCEMDRWRIPQGSAASSLVAEFVMADILRSAADLLRGLTVITYSDNVGILLPTSVDAAVMEQNLRRVFAAHGAGPFRLKTTGPRPLSVLSRFLGYDFQKEKGKSARAFVPVHVLEERETIFYGIF
jgi:hypothetical protein